MEGPPRSLAQRFSDLRVRIMSAAVLAVVGAAAVWAGGPWFALLVAIMAGATAWEWRSVTHHGGRACGPDVVYLIGAVAGSAVAAWAWGVAAGLGWLGLALAAGLAWDVATGRKTAAFWALVGGLYCGAAGIALIWLRDLQPYGLDMVIWVILVVAAADIGGYFAGKTLRGPKLWTRVSPKKTWSGSVGGLALAALFGLGFSWLGGGTEHVEVCIASALVALVSQAGDLAESALKRRFRVKDASNLVPGHGGVLDRFDGLMAAAIVVALVTGAGGQTVLIW